jgi:hypothetical protein
MVCSLLGSCKLQNINPYEYLLTSCKDSLSSPSTAWPSCCLPSGNRHSLPRKHDWLLLQMILDTGVESCCKQILASMMSFFYLLGRAFEWFICVNTTTYSNENPTLIAALGQYTPTSCTCRRKNVSTSARAWHGAWCWQKVVPLLEAPGIQVLTIELPSHGPDTLRWLMLPFKMMCKP